MDITLKSGKKTTKSYDANTDYAAIINDAVAKGDYATAAQAEQSRNEKIKGEGLDYATTNNYSSYLNSNSGGSKGGNYAGTYSPSGDSTGGYSQYTGSSSGVKTLNSTQHNIKNQMNANSMAWQNADPAERKRLETANQNLAKLLGGTVSFDPVSGTWSGTSQGFDWEYEDNRPSEPEQDKRINKLLKQILNRDDFSYDVEDDALYEQYKQMYQREGDRAMRETLAEAASGAGGMNSYAITAAQQANNYYNAQLNDRVPELYQLAYQMYLQDKESMVQDLGLLQDMDATQYARYRDTLNDYYNDKNFAYGMYRDDVNQANWQTEFDYNAMLDNIDREKNDYWNQKEWDYIEAENKYNKDKYDREVARDEVWRLIELGVISPELIAKAGMDEETVRAAVDRVLGPLRFSPVSFR